MKRISILILLLMVWVSAVSLAGENNNKTDAESLRWYYGGAWHSSPPFDEEKDFFWDKGRKGKFPEGHIQHPKSGYIFKDGKWEVDKSIRIGKHQTGAYFYDGKWHNRPKEDIYTFNAYWLVKNYRDYIARKDFVCDVMEREYELAEEESARLVKLINSGEAEKMLEIPREKEGRPQFAYDRKGMLMYVKAKSDSTAMLLTLIMNGAIFESYVRASDIGMKFEIYSLVDPVFYEKDAGKSDIVMSMNVSGIVRLLDPESPSYRRSGASFYVFSDYGTIAIVDKEEKLEEIHKYLDSMPYAPVKNKMKLSPGK